MRWRSINGKKPTNICFSPSLDLVETCSEKAIVYDSTGFGAGGLRRSEINSHRRIDVGVTKIRV